MLNDMYLETYVFTPSVLVITTDTANCNMFLFGAFISQCNDQLTCLFQPHRLAYLVANKQKELCIKVIVNAIGN